jgi:preprotein translocase subunit YajC
VGGVAKALPLVLLLLFAYVLLIRAPRKRAQETAALQSRLSPGDDVMLTSGIFGQVRTVLDDVFTVEISPGVVVRVHRGAIGTIVHDVDTEDTVAEGRTADDGVADERVAGDLAVEAPPTDRTSSQPSAGLPSDEATGASVADGTASTEGDTRRGDVV